MDDKHLFTEIEDLRVLVAFVKPEISVVFKLDSAPRILNQRVYVVCICV